MNRSARAFPPLFRTEGQARILAALLLDPDREVPIANLTEASGLSQPATLREVNRLVDAGILQERRSGNYRLVSANTASPFHEPLVQILSRTHGPLSAVTERLREIPGIDHALFIGSWAARLLGVPGHQPRDVDVVVVGAPPGRVLRRAASELTDDLGLPVHITVVPLDEWHEASTGFVRDVQSSPSVLIDLEQATS
jgi:DNA-binding transcriptional ArsR family regulator